MSRAPPASVTLRFSFPASSGKDAQSQQLVEEIVGVGGGIGLGDAQKDKQSRYG